MKRLLAFLLTLILLTGSFAGCKENPVATNPTDSAQEISLQDPNGVEYESLAQKAVVKTALAYLARGTRIQYDDSRLTENNATPLYRWQHGLRLSPEEYTSQYIGYTNCAAFTYDVYFAALGIRIEGHATNQLTQITGKQRIYKYYPTGKETPEEQAAVEAEFRSLLKMGDIIVIRYNGSKTGNGHAMLYVGSKVLENVDGYKGTAAENTDENGNPADAGYTYDIIHSTGSSYNYTNFAEKFEEHGTIQKMAVDSLFDAKTGRYVFSKLESIAIIRPLETFNREVPENTLNRMRYMENIIAEKLSSHSISTTVNPGENITYTFSVTNKNEKDITLDIKDTIPDNTTYVSSDKTANCSVDGNSLQWKLPVAAGETATVSYTVKVKEDVTYGDAVESAAGTVGGVSVICPKVYVEKTLTQQEQAKLLTAIENQKNSNLRGIELVNALYAEALGTEKVISLDGQALLNDLYLASGKNYILYHSNPTLNMLAPGLFGGRYVIQGYATANSLHHENIRTRLPYGYNLIAGDILTASTGDQNEELKLFLYTGEQMLDLCSTGELSYIDTEKCLEPVMAYNCFAILRPSMALRENNA